MCGIAGFFLTHSRGQSPAPDIVGVLDAHIRSRGPDGSGQFVTPPPFRSATLIHRRLSIIDHAGGAQPMVIDAAGKPVTSRDAEPSLALVFNGCIYNHRSLRAELQSRGEHFTSDHSDTEVLLRGFRAWGTNVFERLEGMFGLAFWRATESGGELILARDRCGEKPLYYLRHENFIAFSSSAAGLFCVGASRAATDADAASLARWVAWGFSDLPLRGVSEVAPGSWISFDSDDTIKTGSFGISPRSPATNSQPLTVESATTLLRSAVKSRLDADVPLGCFLSGGLDSSLVARFAHEERNDLQTFCVAMPDAKFDESEHAIAAAKIIGTRHTTLQCEPNAASDMVMLIEQLGLPLGDSSLLPTYWVSKAARAHIKVALTGDGGDELFRGYRRQVAAEYLRRFRPVIAAAGSAITRWNHRFGSAGRLVNAARGIGYPQISALFAPDQLSQLIGNNAAAECWANASSSWNQAGIAESPWWDFAAYLPGDLMRKVDTASMSVALEVRSPMLDSSLATTCLHASTQTLMPNGRRKGLLQDVALQFFPAKFVARPKQGFSLPLARWFRQDFGGLRTLLRDSVASNDAFSENVLGFHIDRRFVEKMVTEHDQLGRDHSQRLYMILSLALWARWMAKARARP
jgi:asparagine synthase (glutamine-hydrolysing)